MGSIIGLALELWPSRRTSQIKVTMPWFMPASKELRFETSDCRSTSALCSHLMGWDRSQSDDTCEGASGRIALDLVQEACLAVRSARDAWKVGLLRAGPDSPIPTQQQPSAGSARRSHSEKHRRSTNLCYAQPGEPRRDLQLRIDGKFLGVALAACRHKIRTAGKIR